MTSWLDALENTWLSTTLRDSPNVFLYPTILAFHTLGLAFFVGISSAIALRIFGVAPGLPLAPFKKLYPVMWLGFFFNAVSGLRAQWQTALGTLVVTVVMLATGYVSVRLWKWVGHGTVS